MPAKYVNKICETCVDQSYKLRLTNPVWIKTLQLSYIFKLDQLFFVDDKRRLI